MSDTNLVNELETMDTLNLEKIKTIYEERRKKSDHESLKIIRNTILIKVKEIKAEIEQHLERCNIRDTLEKFKILYNYKKDFAILIKEIDSHFTTIKSKIEKKFNEIYRNFNSIFGGAQRICEIETDILSDFSNLIEFSKFKIESNGKMFINL